MSVQGEQFTRWRNTFTRSKTSGYIQSNCLAQTGLAACDY